MKKQSQVYSRTRWYVVKESVPSVLDAAQSPMHGRWCVGDACAMLSRQQLHSQAHPEDRNIASNLKKSRAEACICNDKTTNDVCTSSSSSIVICCEG